MDFLLILSPKKNTQNALLALKMQSANLYYKPAFILASSLICGVELWYILDFFSLRELPSNRNSGAFKHILVEGERAGHNGLIEG